MTTRYPISELAAAVVAAEVIGEAREALTDDWPDLSPSESYAIQDAALKLRLDRGEQVVGVKLGLTSITKQRQMNVNEPLTAWLTDAMALIPGAPVPHDRLIHPRAEPEIVFVMGERLEGPGVDAETALAAVAKVTCGIEIIDSRYRDFRFRLPDVIADNASAAFFTTGPTHTDPLDVDLAIEKCEVTVDGKVVAVGCGADVQGHPAKALALAANALAARGHVIEAGWTVLTGGITDAVALEANSRFEVRFDHLGTLALNSAG